MFLLVSNENRHILVKISIQGGLKQGASVHNKSLQDKNITKLYSQQKEAE